MPNVVITNDDGPTSPGLRALLRELRGLARLLTVVPEKNMGGMGKSITLRKPIAIRELGPSFYAISGTPADAFLIALELLRPDRPDALVSGINMGPNIGIEDLLHSGTLGAALQAALHGVPAIAVSYAIGTGFPRPTEERMERDLALAARLVARLLEAVLEGGLPEGVDLVSVNVPVGADEGRVLITEPLREPFWTTTRIADGFIHRPWGGGVPEGPPGTDIWALLNGHIAITPIGLGLKSNKQALGELLAEAGIT